MDEKALTTASELVGRAVWIGLLSAVILYVARNGASGHEGHDLGLSVRVPLLMSPEARAGKKLYESKCRTCHGKNAEGTHAGPSLIPYDQAHHPDGDFSEAIRFGVKQHHWNFGDMPPIEGVTDEDIRILIRYVRELQAFNEGRNNER